LRPRSAPRALRRGDASRQPRPHRRQRGAGRGDRGRPRRPLMALYALLRELPLRVDAYELDPQELYVRPEFTRKTTVVRLLGDGEEGLGEHVTSDRPLQEWQQQRGPVLPLAGEWTIDGFSRQLETVALFLE